MGGSSSSRRSSPMKTSSALRTSSVSESGGRSRSLVRRRISLARVRLSSPARVSNDSRTFWAAGLISTSPIATKDSTKLRRRRLRQTRATTASRSRPRAHLLRPRREPLGRRRQGPPTRREDALYRLFNGRPSWSRFAVIPSRPTACRPSDDRSDTDPTTLVSSAGVSDHRTRHRRSLHTRLTPCRFGWHLNWGTSTGACAVGSFQE